MRLQSLLTAAMATVVVSWSPCSLGSEDNAPYTKLRDKIIALEVVGREKTTGREISTFGTGFVIHPAGYLLTTEHLYEELIAKGAEEPTLKTTAHVADFTSPPIQAELVDHNKHDLAILKLASRIQGYPFAKIMCNTGFATTFSRFHTSGFYYYCITVDPASGSCLQGTLRYSQASGNVGPTDDSALADTYDVDINFSHGNSGSPIYIPNGLVIAVAKGNIQSAANKGVIIPITWADPLLRQIPGMPPCADLERCVAARARLISSENFTKSGYAKAPSSGPSLHAASVDADVCYSAPDGFEINGPVSITDGGTDGGRGSIGPVTYSADENGRTVRACVKLRAWGEDKLFGQGGMQYVTLSGLIHKQVVDPSALVAAKRHCLSEDVD